MNIRYFNPFRLTDPFCWWHIMYFLTTSYSSQTPFLLNLIFFSKLSSPCVIFVMRGTVHEKMKISFKYPQSQRNLLWNFHFFVSRPFNIQGGYCFPFYFILFHTGREPYAPLFINNWHFLLMITNKTIREYYRLFNFVLVVCVKLVAFPLILWEAAKKPPFLYWHGLYPPPI